MMDKVKKIEELLRDFVNDNILVFGYTREGEIVYVVFILGFATDDIKVYRVRFENVYYILTDKGEVLDELEILRGMGVNVRKLDEVVIPEVFSFIGEVVSRVKAIEQKIKTKLV